MLKKLITLILSAVLLFSAVACGGEEDQKPSPSGNRNYGTEIDGALNTRVAFSGDDLVLSATAFDFILQKEQDGYSLVLKKDGKTLAIGEMPVKLYVVGRVSSMSADETVYQKTYDALYCSEKGLPVAVATVKTSEGSELDVVDTFSFSGKSVDVSRSVRVITAKEKDTGFRSEFVLRSAIQTDGTGDYSDCEYFIPSILYKDNQNMVSSAIGASTRAKSILVKETRTGLPMAMLREKQSGATVSIAHRDPKLSSPDERNYSAFTVSDEFQCGSIGIVRDPSPSVVFCYPNHETQGYVVNKGVTKRFAECKDGNSVAFTMGIYADVTENYTDAFVSAYQEQFDNQEKTYADVDLSELYDISISDLKALYSYDAASGAAGVPFATYVESGKNSDISYQIGFIGMQTSLAHQMIRYGLKHTDSTSYENGISIIDYWTEYALTGAGVFRIWSYSTGGFTSHPCYLRTMTDGAEGILDALRLMKEEGRKDIDLSGWENAVTSYANFLLNAQNEDGSWYRAYGLDGKCFSADNSYGLSEETTTLADSKLNTPVAIRYLVRMYEYTGNKAYLEAAKKAGAFTIDQIASQGKYVGGTPDNANTCDREAGIYAMYAFNALYSATKEQTYLYYAEQSAVFTLSWMYTYKFNVANPDDNLAGNVLEDGKNDGLSMIATGHSSVDTFISAAYYELFKLWIWTEKDFYFDAAYFVQTNSRQTFSCVSDLGYVYGSFAVEATDISNFYFVTAENGVWLPWITNSNVEPIANMLQTFGNADVSALKKTGIAALRAKLDAYGAGGNAYGYVI